MDIILSSISNSTISIYSNLKKLFRCSNCKFSNEGISSNLNITCSRTANYQNDNIKINCSMYLYKGK